MAVVVTVLTVYGLVVGNSPLELLILEQPLDVVPEQLYRRQLVPSLISAWLVNCVLGELFFWVLNASLRAKNQAAQAVVSTTARLRRAGLILLALTMSAYTAVLLHHHPRNWPTTDRDIPEPLTGAGRLAAQGLAAGVHLLATWRLVTTAFVQWSALHGSARRYDLASLPVAANATSLPRERCAAAVDRYQGSADGGSSQMSSSTFRFHPERVPAEGPSIKEAWLAQAQAGADTTSSRNMGSLRSKDRTPNPFDWSKFPDDDEDANAGKANDPSPATDAHRPPSSGSKGGSLGRMGRKQRGRRSPSAQHKGEPVYDQAWPESDLGMPSRADGQFPGGLNVPGRGRRACEEDDEDEFAGSGGSRPLTPVHTSQSRPRSDRTSKASSAVYQAVGDDGPEVLYEVVEPGTGVAIQLGRVDRDDSAFLHRDNSNQEQILRNTSAYACLLNKNVVIEHIRAKRSKPGLKAQHKTGLVLQANMCRGRLRNATVGSDRVEIYPNQLAGGTFAADVQTAGSTCLLIQSALPLALFAPEQVELQLRGGTNAEMAPQVDYFERVFVPLLEKFGGHCDCRVVTRGFFPKGQGEVHLSVPPVPRLHGMELLERGEVARVTGLSYVAGPIPDRVAREMAAAARRALRAQYPDLEVNIEEQRAANAVGAGTGIVLVAETSTGCRLGGSALGKRGVPAEKVGRAAAQELLAGINAGGCVDEYAADQIIILMALASGTSRVRTGPLSLHTETAIHLARELSGAKISVSSAEDPHFPEARVIECHGIGFTPDMRAASNP
ncbi:uncharacterized protein MONBRDRAFT_25783 [Monosiga brevicollis MX1]|uniref:RNA 3'-terminal phosphate cyclase n=1 Tax=Monosiga brevicollis TaxID=81824 RepID=A9V0E9_MONBE|nr:uncharacterized protein MONBRDRAFT_25783 [Monosiga brevicollis MX1]EDQ89146.1 predicted protein [Monosiga brevicollis MX1]|eukprot:XP_001746251.1 hypothetical protein [Monosiga brevicollis MX1]